MDITEKVYKTIRENELIEKGDTVIIGVSGGPDSMTLLNILINLKDKLSYNIVVAHINHGLRKEADEETKYVDEFCKKRNIPFYVKKANVKELAKEQKIGTEEAGRKLRYDFFEEVAKEVKANKIATAHTANDNAETVLMNIMRGSGTSGLKGIEPKRNNKYIRPLIKCMRSEIEKYCDEQNLKPKEDKTNKENIYTRNKIRNILIPMLIDEFNPNIITALNRMSEIAKEEDEYMQKKVEEAYKDIVIKENLRNEDNQTEDSIELDLKKFNKEESVIKNRLVLYTIKKLTGTSQNIEKIHITDIINLCNNNIGNKYLTPNKKIKVAVNKGRIIYKKNI